MINEALKKAKELLNDKSLRIIRYAETKDYYLFEYGTQDGKAVFDNTLIKVTKNNIASYYIITEHFDELDKLDFKTIDAK